MHELYMIATIDENERAIGAQMAFGWEVADLRNEIRAAWPAGCNWTIKVILQPL